MPAALAPKVAITSNYALKGSAAAHERRKYEMELFRYYDQFRTPLNDFDGGFFENWKAPQWNDFYWVMLDCVQTYLRHGINNPMPKYASETLIFNKLKSQIGDATERVIAYFDKQPRTELIHSEDLRKGLGMPEVSSTQLGKWLKLYCDSYKLKFDNPRKMENGKKVTYYRIENR